MLKGQRIKMLILLLAISLILVSCQSYAEDFEQVSDEDKLIIRFSHVVGEDTPKGLAARRFAQLIKERSLGKIEVQVFANSSLYTDGEEWDALLNGDIQMIAPAMSKMTDKITELQIFDLPFFFSSLEQVYQMTDGKIGEQIFHSAKKFKVMPIAIWDNGFKQFTSNSSFLNRPEFFQGLTFRIMPSPVLMDQFRLVGAKPEVRNFNDVYQSIISRQIDGQENTISNIYTKRFFEIQDYLTISNHGYLGYLVMINQGFWDSLSVDYQELISSTMDEVTEWQRIKAMEIAEKQLRYIENSNSIEIRELTEEEWLVFNKLYQPLHEKLKLKLSPIIIEEMKALNTYPN